MPSHELKFVSVDELRPHPKNARTHSKKQVRQIADGIRRLGFNSPIVADEHLIMLAGHGRLEAAKLEGLREVQVLVVSGLRDTQKRAFALRARKPATGWLSASDSNFDAHHDASGR